MNATSLKSDTFQKHIPKNTYGLILAITLPIVFLIVVCCCIVCFLDRKPSKDRKNITAPRII